MRSSLAGLTAFLCAGVVMALDGSKIGVGSCVYGLCKGDVLKKQDLQRGELEICNSHQCQNLIKRLKHRGSSYNYYAYSHCENSKCEDILTERHVNGTIKCYKCNELGCAKINNKHLNKSSAHRVSSKYPTRIVCQSQMCKDLISKLMAADPYLRYDIKTTCENVRCKDDIAVHNTLKNSAHFFVCYDGGCVLRDTSTAARSTPKSKSPSLHRRRPCSKPPSKGTSAVASAGKKSTASTPREPCRTPECRGVDTSAPSSQSTSKLPPSAASDTDTARQQSATAESSSERAPAANSPPRTETPSTGPNSAGSTAGRQPPPAQSALVSAPQKGPVSSALQQAPPSSEQETAESSTKQATSEQTTTTSSTTTVSSTTNKPKEKECRLPNSSISRIFCSVDCQRCSKFNESCYWRGGVVVTEPVTRIECLPGNRLAEDRDYSLVACVRGEWRGQFSECLHEKCSSGGGRDSYLKRLSESTITAQCPPLESDSVIPTCTYNGKEVDCGKPMMPSTSVKVQCRPSYSHFEGLKKEGVYDRDMRCLYNGKWSAAIPECKPNCGLSKGSDIVEPTIVNGTTTPLGVVPWHAGLYQRTTDGWTYICGGSLITKQVVVTAAHCIRVGSYDELAVTFAKYYRQWDQDEKDTVKRNVSDISVPKEFSAAVTTLLWDVALLLLSEPVQFNSLVMPVCLINDWPAQATRFTGYVVGWGNTKADGEQSDVLLHNNISVSLENSCGLYVAKLVTFDKFCATKDGTSVVEKGDSGGGLTVTYTGGPANQHYLAGIVSVKYNEVSMFTNFTWLTHVAWRITEVNKFQDNLSRCPNGGFLCGLSGPCLSESVKCDGYQQCPDGSDETGCPVEQTITPTSSYISYYGCRLPTKPEHGNLTVITDETPDRYQVMYTCDPGYKKSVLNPMGYCYGYGQWVNGVSCVPKEQTVCGVPENKDSSEYPWLAALYIRINGSRWEHYCAGTLISKHFVLTAARCLVNPIVKNRPENIKVGLGKYRRDFYSDENNSTIVDVDETFVQQFYTGAATDYSADVGLVHLKTKVEISDFINPACFQNIRINSGDAGRVATWGTRQGTTGETVLESELLYVDNADCFRIVDQASQRLITYDKFCATYINGTSMRNIDIGAGISFVNNGHFYVAGVVSAITESVNQTAVITYVYNSEHYGWIKWLVDQAAAQER